MSATPDLLLKGGMLLHPETGETRQADVLIRYRGWLQPYW